MAGSLTVLLVDDHAVVRTGYRALLLQSGNVNQVLEADSGERAYQVFVENQPDIIVMDLSLPGSGGLPSIRRIISRSPKAKILVFSMHDELVYVTRAMEAGARGYMTKSSAPEKLVEAVFCVARGEVYIQPEIAQRIAIEKLVHSKKSALSRLSAREFDVFSLISRGYSTKDAAKELSLSAKTVANHITLIKAKLNVKNSSELTRLAYRHGLIKNLDD